MHAFLVRNTCAASKPVYDRCHPAVSSATPGQEPTFVKLNHVRDRKSTSWRSSTSPPVATRQTTSVPISFACGRISGFDIGNRETA